ncbi:MAG: zf-HC2 domain-containing protein [Bryobacteraceae bacterium]
MHQPIRDHLEAYLRDSEDRRIPREFHAHLAACPSCEADLRGVANHALQLRDFRRAEQLEPRGGFYARVLNRIEEQRASSSFWSLFLEPALGKRLAYACGALVLVLGTYLVSTEPGTQMGGQNQDQNVVISQSQPSSGMDETIQPRDRDAVLVNLASFQE